jgi:hypothetical protein
MAELSVHLKGIGHQGRKLLREYCEELIETLRDRLETPNGSNPLPQGIPASSPINYDIIRGEIKALRALKRHCDEIEKGPI